MHSPSRSTIFTVFCFRGTYRDRKSTLQGSILSVNRDTNLACHELTWNSAPPTGIEIGAGSGFVSLCAAISNQPPKLVLITDYPDDIILNNLKSSVDANRHLITDGCEVKVDGYAWASNPGHLLSYIPDLAASHRQATPNAARTGDSISKSKGFNVMILSDLLYFDRSHDDLIQSIQDLLARDSEARVYVAAGKYTPETVCQSFLDKGNKGGLQWEEISISKKWEGQDPGGTYTVDDIERRKQNSRLWIGRWGSSSSQFF